MMEKSDSVRDWPQRIGFSHQQSKTDLLMGQNPREKLDAHIMCDNLKNGQGLVVSMKHKVATAVMDELEKCPLVHRRIKITDLNCEIFTELEFVERLDLIAVDSRDGLRLGRMIAYDESVGPDGKFAVSLTEDGIDGKYIFVPYSSIIAKVVNNPPDGEEGLAGSDGVMLAVYDFIEQADGMSLTLFARVCDFDYVSGKVFAERIEGFSRNDPCRFYNFSPLAIKRIPQYKGHDREATYKGTPLIPSHRRLFPFYTVNVLGASVLRYELLTPFKQPAPRSVKRESSMPMLERQDAVVGTGNSSPKRRSLDASGGEASNLTSTSPIPIDIERKLQAVESRLTAGEGSGVDIEQTLAVIQADVFNRDLPAFALQKIDDQLDGLRAAMLQNDSIKLAGVLGQGYQDSQLLKQHSSPEHGQLRGKRTNTSATVGAAGTDQRTASSAEQEGAEAADGASSLDSDVSSVAENAVTLAEISDMVAGEHEIEACPVTNIHKGLIVSKNDSPDRYLVTSVHSLRGNVVAMLHKSITNKPASAEPYELRELELSLDQASVRNSCGELMEPGSCIVFSPNSTKDFPTLGCLLCADEQRAFVALFLDDGMYKVQSVPCKQIAQAGNYSKAEIVAKMLPVYPTREKKEGEIASAEQKG